MRLGRRASLLRSRVVVHATPAVLVLSLAEAFIFAHGRRLLIGSWRNADARPMEVDHAGLPAMKVGDADLPAMCPLHVGGTLDSNLSPTSRDRQHKRRSQTGCRTS